MRGFLAWTLERTLPTHTPRKGDLLQKPWKAGVKGPWRPHRRTLTPDYGPWIAQARIGVVQACVLAGDRGDFGACGDDRGGGESVRMGMGPPFLQGLFTGEVPLWLV